MTNVFRHLLLVVVLLGMPAVTAQEDAATDNTAATKTTQQAEAEKEQAEQPQDRPATPDTFKPTEEISEDLSVSFPVDI